jgi:hypothetical protein
MFKHYFMDLKSYACSRPSWSEIEEIIATYESCLSQGDIHVRAVIAALHRHKSRGVHAGLSEVLFRSSSRSDLLCKLVPANCDSDLREAYIALLNAFFDRHGLSVTSKVVALIRENASCSRWLKGQIYQARLQVLVLSLLVPLFSCVFVFLRPDNFFTNMRTAQGVLLFTLALMLFFTGALTAQKTITKGVLNFGDSDLSSLGGMERFIRRLSLLQGQEGHILKSLSGALADQGDIRATRHARLVRFGVLVGSERGKSLSEGISDEFRRGFITQSSEARSRWLKLRHKQIWSELKIFHAQCAAKTNLRLILVMGIFYLPAFFLILWICGTIVSFNNG